MDCTDNDDDEAPRVADAEGVRLVLVEDRNVSGTRIICGVCTCIWCGISTYVEQSES
jgi:hypothetical protein